MADGLYKIFINFVNKCTDMIEGILPMSPFKAYIEQIDDIKWLGYVNYFIPIGTFIAIFSAWLTCMAIFYLYGIIMRWAKIVGE